MVDFRKLRSERKQPVPTDPAAIFQRLPKPLHINDLWNGQGKALAAWNERRKEGDLVIKLNTGGGKTLVGLLITQSLHADGNYYIEVWDEPKFERQHT